jgi:hypothetical protein
VLVYVGWSLLPLPQIRNEASQFGKFDAAIAGAMGVTAFITFGLATAMAVGFAAYTMRSFLIKKEIDWVLAASTAIILLAVGLQYAGV